MFHVAAKSVSVDLGLGWLSLCLLSGLLDCLDKICLLLFSKLIPFLPYEAWLDYLRQLSMPAHFV
jgi:hypothetical protein